MPRKTKDTKSKEIEVKEKKEKKATTVKKASSTKKTASKKVAVKKTDTKKKTTTAKKASTAKKAAAKKTDIEETVVTKKDETKKATTKKATTKKADAEKKSTTKKTATTKKTSTTKNADAKKTDAEEKAVSQKTSTKKATIKKANTEKKSTTTKKTATSKKTSNSKKTASTKKNTTKKTSTPKVDIVEYYDLPYRYNQTIVKVLAQTPTNLFIYWDISDEDRENYKKQYGDNFFETTKPILKIYNDTMHYDFEIEINDFANSWYLHVEDSKCDYRVELGRRPINNTHIQDNYNNSINYIYISSSNEIESPNDKILFNTDEHMVYFRNVKNNSTIGKSMANFSFIRNMGKIYNIYDLYKKIYKDENLEDIHNPSSNFF